MEFNGYPKEYKILRTRTKKFKEENDLSDQRILELAGFEDPHGKRQLLCGFRNGAKTRNLELCRTLWRFFRDEHPDDVLNNNENTNAENENKTYQVLANFFSIGNDTKIAQNVSSSLCGKYYFFRQPWTSGINFSEKLVIGKMEITNELDEETGKNMLQFSGSTEYKNPFNDELRKNTYNGYVFFVSGNVVCIGRDKRSNPFFMIFHDTERVPTTGVKTQYLLGNSFAGIGVNDHRSLRVALHSTNDFKTFPPGIYEKLKLDYFGQELLKYLNE